MPQPPKRYRASQLIAAMAASAGLTQAQFRAAAGLPRNLDAQGRSSLSSAQMLQAWAAFEELASIAHDIEALQNSTRGIFRADSYALACSPSLRAGLARVAELRALASPVRIVIEEHDTLDIHFVGAEAAAPITLLYAEKVQLIDMVLAASGDRVRPVGVGAQRDDPRNAALGAWLGVEVAPTGGARVSFSREHADMAMEPHAPHLFAPFTLPFEPAITEPIVSRAKAALIAQLPTGDASMATTAQRLNMTPRTLQRRLAAEGISFGGLLETTRRELANSYLTLQDIRIEEISQLLGYSDPNSFYRAYQGWTGHTPKKLRTRFD
ncbi:MAG: helix-turn-helix transcriptional regulator [Pseudomonadota bacterium]